MASQIQAIRQYMPKIIKGDRATAMTAAELIAGRTSATVGEVYKFYMEFKNALYFFLREGRPLRLEGIGTFTPSIGLDGKFKVKVRTDRGLLANLNKPDEGFIGRLKNAVNIGKTSDELVVMWNEEHPDDLVV